MKYARINGNVAVDVRADSPEGCFTPNIVAEFVQVPDKVFDGWVKSGNSWAAPAAPEVGAPAAPVPPKVTPVQFKLLFTAMERIAIYAAIDGNPVLKDMFSLLDDVRLTEVDLSLKSNQDALDYLTAEGFLAAGRKAEILTGAIK